MHFHRASAHTWSALSTFRQFFSASLASCSRRRTSTLRRAALSGTTCATSSSLGRTSSMRASSSSWCDMLASLAHSAVLGKPGSLEVTCSTNTAVLEFLSHITRAFWYA